MKPFLVLSPPAPPQSQSGRRLKPTAFNNQFPTNKTWCVQNPGTPDRPTASHYPCAIEHDGRLFVLYTAGLSGRRQCELAIIPITSLQVTNK